MLKGNDYPGRGIILGSSGSALVAAYFIMGRSENSRNRVFIETSDGIKTQCFDSSKMVDPSLIIYRPVRKFGNSLIVTNGDQTDTVYDFLQQGKTFEQALETRTFEPDSPNFTPRISGLLTKDGYKLSILKTEDNGKSCERLFFNYKYSTGKGRLIHTYQHDGDPIPSFGGDPEIIDIDGDINFFTNFLWDSLSEENRVSLFVRYIYKDSEKTLIINKNEV